MPTTGYSGTPLAKKLGIKSGFDIKVFAAPSYYLELFDDWPEGVSQISNPGTESLDFIHLFVKDSIALEMLVREAMPLLKKNGSMWVSWPKGSSGIKTDINRESVRDYLLKTGLVDIKVAAVDDQWSALKFMYRTMDR